MAMHDGSGADRRTEDDDPERTLRYPDVQGVLDRYFPAADDERERRGVGMVARVIVVLALAASVALAAHTTSTRRPGEVGSAVVRQLVSETDTVPAPAPPPHRGGAR